MKNKNISLEEDPIATAFRNPEKIREAMQKSVWAALLEHKRAGNPICVWRNNQVVWIPPEDINVPIQPNDSK